MSTPETDSLLGKCHNGYGAERTELIHLCRKMEAALADAAQLLAEIMRDQVNHQDESEKWLRAYAPQHLSPPNNETLPETMSDTPETQCGTTHYAGCACHEKGWENKWQCAVEMAAQAEAKLNAILAILKDPAAVHINLLRGTIAWTPEHLRHVLGDSTPNNEIAKS